MSKILSLRRERTFTDVLFFLLSLSGSENGNECVPNPWQTLNVRMDMMQGSKLCRYTFQFICLWDFSSWSNRVAGRIPSEKKFTTVPEEASLLPNVLPWCRVLLYQLCYPLSFSALDCSWCHGRNTAHAFVYLFIFSKLQITTWNWICLVDHFLLQTWLQKQNIDDIHPHSLLHDTDTTPCFNT